MSQAPQSNTWQQNPGQPNQQAPQGTPPPAPPKSGCGCFLKGCLVFFLGGILLCGGAGVYLYFNGRAVFADFAVAQVEKVVDASDLPADQKKVVKEQAVRVADAFKEDRITPEQGEALVKSFTEGPLFVLMMAYSVEEKYVKPSGLSIEERKEAHLTLQRLARGVHEKLIDPKRVEAIFDPIFEKGPNKQKKLPDTISDEKLRTLLRDSKQAADDAKIPNEEFTVDVGQAVKEAVDKALGETTEDEAPDEEADDAAPKQEP